MGSAEISGKGLGKRFIWILFGFIFGFIGDFILILFRFFEDLGDCPGSPDKIYRHQVGSAEIYGKGFGKRFIWIYF